VFDYRNAVLRVDEKALCDFAVKLTLQPGDILPADIEDLRRQGWDDDQITIAVQVIGYFNYINRVADGLGVDHEPWMDLPIDDWRAKKANDWAS